MEFTTEGAAIADGLRVIRRLAPPNDGNVTIVSDGKTLNLVSINEINCCRIRIPGEVSKKAEFGIAADTLEQATKGRGELTLTYKNTVLHISSKSYKAQLPTVDPMQYEDAPVEGEKKIKISNDQAAWLKQAVAATSLKATAIVSTFMPMGVSFGSKSAFVASFDASHMAFTSSAEITGDSEFIVPSDLMAGILDAFGAQSFVLHVSQSAVRVTNKLSEVRLNLPELDEQGPNLAMVKAKAKAIKKSNGTEMSLDRNAVVAFLDNSRAVAMKERGAVEVSADGKKVTMSVTTVNGTVRASLKCNAKVNFVIDYEYFDEMIRKSADPVQLKAVESAFLVCTSAKAVLVATFNT